MLGGVILGITLVNLRGVFSLVRTQTEYEATIDRVTKAKKAGREAQINFKIQVQEWKNVLLRGTDRADFERYFSQFESREARVRDNLRDLKAFTGEALPGMRDRIRALLETHRSLGTAYREALAAFDPDDPTSYRIVDRRVRGIDRAPQRRLEAVTALVDETMDRLLADVRARVSAAKTEAVWTSSIVVAMGFLVTAFLLYQVYASSKRLERARLDAIEASRAKSLFLANMSHEIRTPLNGVIGMLEVLSASDLDEDQREQLQIIRGSGETLLAILNDILDYSKIEAGKVDIEPTPTSIRELVDAVVALFKARAFGMHIDIYHELDPSLPEAVRVDPLRLRQILLNLVQNAVKFTEVGFVRVSVDWKPAADVSVPGQLMVSVADSGIGIPEAKAARLFESFYQAETDPDRRYGGSGLGLTICQRLVTMMGGHIEVESTEGVGSVFRFSVPAEACSAGEEPSAGSSGTGGPATGENGRDAGAERGGATGPGDPATIAAAFEKLEGSLSVLLAEDNAVNQKVAMRMLEKGGLRADLAVDGEAAVEAYREKRYDIILMDIQMPRLSGTEATKQIRELSGTRDRPWIIALTAGALQENKAEAFEAGLNDYLSKPFTAQTLLGKIADAARRQGRLD